MKSLFFSFAVALTVTLCSLPVAAHTDLLTHIPIGDGRLSDQPKRGFIWSCNTRFGGGGAHATGEWINEDGSYDLTTKVTVDGQVSWPNIMDILNQGNKRLITTNNLPNHSTGQFPISRKDDVYQYDRNPNAIKAQKFRLQLNSEPELANHASCLSMGPIGVMLTGSVLFNGLDARGQDAVAHEILDACQGHPERTGTYHYHNLTLCLEDGGDGHSGLVGYALDGFGIYGPRGVDGQILTNEDLDECHGHTHLIEWDGEMVEMYHYHTTTGYPYTLGCFSGTPNAIEGMRRPPMRRRKHR